MADYDNEFDLDPRFINMDQSHPRTPETQAQTQRTPLFMPNDDSSSRSISIRTQTEAHIEEVEEDELHEDLVVKEAGEESAEDITEEGSNSGKEVTTDNFNPTTPVVRYDVSDLVERWEKLQGEVAEKIQTFSESVLKNAFQLILDTSHNLWMRNEETRIKLEETVAGIQGEEDKQEEMRVRIAAYIKKMEEATSQLTREFEISV